MQEKENCHHLHKLASTKDDGRVLQTYYSGLTKYSSADKKHWVFINNSSYYH